MIRRPLCLLFLLLCLFTAMGGGFTKELIDKSASLQIEKSQKKKEDLSVCGLVYKGEIKHQKNLIYLRNSILKIQSQNYSLKNVIIEVPDETYYSIGMKLEARGSLSLIEGASNPGEFDLKTYYKIFSISSRMRAKQIKVISSAHSKYGEFLRRLQSYASFYLRKALPKREGGLIEAMVLGSKEAIEEEDKTLFQVTGTIHVLVISGLHINLLGLGLYKILKKLRWGQMPAATASAALLISYALMTGYAPATLRAIFMFLIKILGKKWGRSYDALSSLSFSGILLLLKNPNYLYYSGFWLSTMAVVGVGLLREERVSAKGQKSPGGFLCKSLLSGIRAYVGSQLVTLPILMYMYGEIYPYGIVMNLLLLPSLSFLLLSGLLGILLSFISPFLGGLFLLPAVCLLKVYLFLMESIKSLPASCVITGSPPFWLILFYYGGISILLYLIKVKKKRLQVLFLPLLLLLFLRPVCHLKITNLDVGQGDGCLIEAGRNLVCMVDGGSSSKKEVGRRILIPFLKHEGVGHIHYMIVTHSDADHYNGLAEILQDIGDGELALRVDTLILPLWQEDDEELKLLDGLAKKAGIEVLRVRKGQILRDKKTGTQIEILHPDGEDYREKSNEGSVVFALKQKGFTGIFTGDIEGEAEKALSKGLFKCDYLKVSHHGSKGASCKEFLEKAAPRVGVISCGKNSRYGHPSKEALARLEKVCSHIFRTDEQGAVWMEKRKGRLKYFTFR